MDRSSSAVEGPAWATPRAIGDSERPRSRAVSRGPRRADGLCAHAAFDGAVRVIARCRPSSDAPTASTLTDTSSCQRPRTSLRRRLGLECTERPRMRHPESNPPHRSRLFDPDTQGCLPRSNAAHPRELGSRRNSDLPQVEDGTAPSPARCRRSIRPQACTDPGR